MDDRSAIWRQARAGELDLLYVSPEGLAQPHLIDRLHELPLSLIAIDEAHCVSQWGHDFRPDYRTLGRLAELFPGVPRIAVTATADARTREDIVKSLRLDDARVFVDSFARPNLQLSAERKELAWRARTDAHVIALVRERRGKSGVVYCGSRDGCERVAGALRDAGTNAIAYHAGMDARERDRLLARFLAEDGAVMVATIAFGMGVDKADVRFVIHADPPGSLEAYWQEIGRAGRDGEPAEGITLYGPSDIAWTLKRLDSRPMDKAVKAVQVRKARQLFAMLDGAVCRPQTGCAAISARHGDAGPWGLQGHLQGDRPPALVDANRCRPRRPWRSCRGWANRSGATWVIDGPCWAGPGTRRVETGPVDLGDWADLHDRQWRDVMDPLLFEGLLVEDPQQSSKPLIVGWVRRRQVRGVYSGRAGPIEVAVDAGAAPVPRRERPADRVQCGVSRPWTTTSAARFELLRAWRSGAGGPAEGAALCHLPGSRTLLGDGPRPNRPVSATAPRPYSGALARTKLDRYGKAVLQALGG